MGTPEFIRNIRATAGRQLLLRPGVSAVVLDGERRVLLGRRADIGKWGAGKNAVADPAGLFGHAARESPVVTASISRRSTTRARSRISARRMLRRLVNGSSEARAR